MSQQLLINQQNGPVNWKIGQTYQLKTVRFQPFSNSFSNFEIYVVSQPVFSGSRETLETASFTGSNRFVIGQHAVPTNGDLRLSSFMGFLLQSRMGSFMT
jgi:hypothetical protein